MSEIKPGMEKYDAPQLATACADFSMTTACKYKLSLILASLAYSSLQNSHENKKYEPGLLKVLSWCFTKIHISKVHGSIYFVFIY